MSSSKHTFSVERMKECIVGFLLSQTGKLKCFFLIIKVYSGKFFAVLLKWHLVFLDLTLDLNKMSWLFWLRQNLSAGKRF